MIVTAHISMRPDAGPADPPRPMVEPEPAPAPPRPADPEQPPMQDPPDAPLKAG